MSEQPIQTQEFISFPRLARKGFHVSVPRLDEKTWSAFTARDPAIPRTFARLRSYGRLIYGPARRKAPRIVKRQPAVGSIRSLYEECGEVAWQRVFRALANPYLTTRQRAIIEAEIDADMPAFDHSCETDHFILRWTDSSANASDNIADETIITDTGDYLETAWDRYVDAFGRAPYLPAGSSKMEVVFYDIPGAHGVASPPDGPIQLNSDSWVSTPGLRQSVSAHELFHKLQYAFGYRTVWEPVSPYKWFSEGTASWSEVFVWGRVSRATKVTDMFTNPDLNLRSASYSALPFWVFFEVRQRSDATDNPISHYLTTIEPDGALLDALEQVVDEEWAPNNVYGELDSFYALFARDRCIGHWRIGPMGGFYPDILAPDGTEVVPNLNVTDVPLGLSDTYDVAGTVSQLGSDYYRFAFDADANGASFSLSATGAAGGDYSYYLIWEKDGNWRRAAFPFGSSDSYGYTETIDLAEADALVIAISGRGVGGAYTLSASIA